MAEEGDFYIDLTNFGSVPAVDDSRWQDFEVRQRRLDDEEELTTPAWDDERDFEDLYSAETLWKARLLLESKRVEEINPRQYSVEGSQPYVVDVMPDAGMPVPWAVCSCPNGTARGGRPSCYHTAAVLALLLGIDLSRYEKPTKGPAKR